jgi:hypothetical protein
MKRVFITEYVGLSTRLEALAMAFMIADYFGHGVCIDWRDLDALNVVGAEVRSRGVLGRLNSLKLRSDTIGAFYEIPKYRNVNLRTHEGPNNLLKHYYLPTAQRIKLRPDLIEVIYKAFEPYQNRPLVGVHIRRGDFPVIDQKEFDVNGAEWQSAPNWWYAHVMAQIRNAIPDVTFFVSCTGTLEDFPFLKQFDVFDLPANSPKQYKIGGHESLRHPAADLFALGCCKMLIGSSCSTFTHYAANMLGGPTTVLVPPAHKISAISPEFGQVQLYGQGAVAWLSACRTGNGLQMVSDSRTLPSSIGANVKWM